MSTSRNPASETGLPVRAGNPTETAAFPDLPGYRILEKIGEGAAGVVYRAHQEALDRTVAIKILSMTSQKEVDSRMQRFQREARLMARVAHPHVLTVYDVGLWKGQPYLVAEYLEGGNLRALMTPGQPMSPESFLSVFEPVVSALTALHQQGIIHRDLKPENILLHHPQHPKVGDFGIAVLRTEAGALTRHGETFGTFGYVAPEQQYGLAVDERADQYSLAALAYEALTGGHLPLGVIRKPSEYNPALSGQLDQVLMRALCEAPEERFASIAEFGTALVAALNGPEPAAQVCWWWNRVAFGCILMVAFASLVIGWLMLGVLERSDPEVAGMHIARSIEPSARFVIDALGMELVLIPAGEIHVRTEDSEKSPGVRKPNRILRIDRPFYLGVCEVTVDQFRIFVDDTGYQTTAELDGGGFTFDEESGEMRQYPEITWRNPGVWNELRGDHPVVQVSWEDAMAFCAWLSRREGQDYRLPSEAEWEYACRAGSLARWPWGDDPGPLDGHTWYAANSDHALHPVRSKLPNEFGLFDMLGNVHEWCSDAHHPEAEKDAGRAFRPVRGGAMDTEAPETCCAACQYSYPTYRCRTYGFRIARSVPEQSTPSEK